MSATDTQAATPDLIGPTPLPLRRDRMVQVWLAAVTISWLGDAAWMVALAWTAAHTYSPATAGVIIGAEMIPQAAFVLVGGVIADRFDPVGAHRRPTHQGHHPRVGSAGLDIRADRRAHAARDRAFLRHRHRFG